MCNLSTITGKAKYGMKNCFCLLMEMIYAHTMEMYYSTVGDPNVITLGQTNLITIIQ
jgi:hypothetical protein